MCSNTSWQPGLSELEAYCQGEEASGPWLQGIQPRLRATYWGCCREVTWKMKLWPQWYLRPLRMLIIPVNLGFVFNLDSTVRLLALSIITQTTALPMIMFTVPLVSERCGSQREGNCASEHLVSPVDGLCAFLSHICGMFPQLRALGNRLWAKVGARVSCERSVPRRIWERKEGRGRSSWAERPHGGGWGGTPEHEAHLRVCPTQRQRSIRDGFLCVFRVGSGLSSTQKPKDRNPKA